MSSSPLIGCTRRELVPIALWFLRRREDQAMEPSIQLRTCATRCGFRRIRPLLASEEYYRIFLRGASGTNRDCGKMPAMRIADQPTRVVVIRKKQGGSGHRRFAGMRGSPRRSVTTARRTSMAYCLYRFARGLALNRGKIRAFLAPTLHPLGSQRSRAERNTARNRD